MQCLLKEWIEKTLWDGSLKSLLLYWCKLDRVQIMMIHEHDQDGNQNLLQVHSRRVMRNAIWKYLRLYFSCFIIYLFTQGGPKRLLWRARIFLYHHQKCVRSEGSISNKSHPFSSQHFSWRKAGKDCNYGYLLLQWHSLRAWYENFAWRWESKRRKEAGHALSNRLCIFSLHQYSWKLGVTRLLLG